MQKDTTEEKHITHREARNILKVLVTEPQFQLNGRAEMMKSN